MVVVSCYLRAAEGLSKCCTSLWEFAALHPQAWHRQYFGMQVISTELNRAVVELLQQLLFWQERAKATSPYNVTKRKRLVSGLRYCPAIAPHPPVTLESLLSIVS